MSVSLLQRVVGTLGRRYPFLSGANQIVNGRFGGKSLFAGSGRVWAKSKFGEVLVDLDDYVGRSVYFTGDLDHKITGLCQAFLKPGDQAADIGGHVGLVTLAMASAVGNDGKVYVFEPNPDNNKRIELAVTRAKLAQVVQYRFALADREGDVTLRIPEGNSGAASINRHGNREECREIQVAIRRLDDVVKADKIQPVLIKMDAEGAEADIFEGGREWFSNSPPLAVLFESNPDPESGVIDKRPFEFLLDMGFRIFAVQKTLLKLKLKEVDATKAENAGHDYMALHGGDRFSEILERFGKRVFVSEIS